MELFEGVDRILCMETLKKTTIYQTPELSESLRLLSFQMYCSISDMLVAAVEQKYGACFEEGKNTNFGPKNPSPEWEAIQGELTRIRQTKLYARKRVAGGLRG
jgi:hypothetical protein